MTGDGHPHRPAVIIGSAAGSRRRLRSTDGRTAALSPCPARTNMTGERYQDLPAAKRRRVAFRACCAASWQPRCWSFCTTCFRCGAYRRQVRSGGLLALGHA